MFWCCLVTDRRKQKNRWPQKEKEEIARSRKTKDDRRKEVEESYPRGFHKLI